MKCETCDNPAVCVIKQCDGDLLNQPACSDCCGHGDEDGSCDFIAVCEDCEGPCETEMEQKRKKHWNCEEYEANWP